MAPVYEALPSTGDEDDVANCMSNPLWTDPERSAELLAPLAQLLLPEPVLSYVTSHGGSTPVLLAIAPGGLTWSRVPWELLPLPDGRRLIEAATIRYEPPAAELRDERDRLTGPIRVGSHRLCDRPVPVGSCAVPWRPPSVAPAHRATPPAWGHAVRPPQGADS